MKRHALEGAVPKSVVAKTVVQIGIGVLIVVVSGVVYRAFNRPSPDAVPEPLIREFRSLSAELGDLSRGDGRGMTQEKLDLMLYASARHTSADMVKWLLQKGANPKVRQNVRLDPSTRSVLQVAAYGRHCEILKLLIQNVADTAAASSRQSPSGSREARVAEQVALFVNERDANDIDALHEAVDGGERECVATLLAAGARADAKDYRGLTPLALARKKQFNHLVPMLKDALERQGGGEESSDAESALPQN